MNRTSQDRQLDTVQKLRRRARDAQASSVAEVVRARSVLAEQMQTLGRDRAAATARRVGLARGEVDVERLLDETRHDAGLSAELANLRQQDGLLAEEERKRRGTLLAADVEVKAIEKLQARIEQRRRDERRRREDRELADQIAARRSTP